MKKQNKNTNAPKRGAIYYNVDTNRCERVVTVNDTHVGTKTDDENETIEFHSRASLKPAGVSEIKDFLGNDGKFAKTAIAITDADKTAIAIGDKVIVIAHSDSRLEKIQAAVKTGNMRSLAQLVSNRATKREVMSGVRVQLKINN